VIITTWLAPLTLQHPPLPLLQVTNTTGLEGALRQAGMALTALLHLQHRTSAGATERYLAEPAAEGGAPRVLKLGDFHMKRLKNGDVYKVRVRLSG
jgi:hypothetical protein